MTISLLHPSRGRPTKALETINLWKSRASGQHKIEHILSIDFSDSELDNYKRAAYSDWTVILCSENDCAVMATNKAAKISHGDILVMLSDDFECPQDWDNSIVQAFQNRSGVLKTYDGLQKWLVTLAIMDRKYYEEQGYFYYPSYRHMFCLHPDTLIYMGDYSFKKIKDIKAGELVIGTHRTRSKPEHKSERDFLIRTEVLQTHSRIDTVCEITLESGVKLYSTIDHKWAHYNGDRQVRYGAPQVGQRLKKVLELPGNPPEGMEWERGWLAGMWDGEGSFDVLSQSINHNPKVCEKIEEVLNKIGLKYSITHYTSKVWKKSTQRLFTINGGRNEYIKMLNWLNPVKRVTPRADKRLLSARYGMPDTIVAINKVAEMDVYCLTTGTKNFIADGYLSHNCDTEMTHKADLEKKLIVRNDLVFPHKHYSTNGGKEDETTKRANATWNQGEKIYMARVKNCFGLQGVDPLNISDKQTADWLRNKLKQMA